MIRPVLLAAFAAVANAIYPDDHWSYSTQLTQANFESTIQDAIDADKTMFAPGWNEAVKAFAGNNDVAFGDVNLSEESIRGPPHNPGSGGWPTIRYFNKETGVEGANYVKKTDMAMCDELKDLDNMMAYIEEAGKTSLCSAVKDGYPGCSDKEKAFITKMLSKGSEEYQKQLDRLEKMAGESMKPDLKAWVKKRTKILKQLVPQADEQEL